MRDKEIVNNRASCPANRSTPACLFESHIVKIGGIVMSPMNETQIETVLTNHALTLNNALADPEISAMVALRGFPPEKLNEGLTKIETARDKQEARLVAAGAQLAATDRFKAAFAEARTVYADFRETARAHYGSEAQNREIWEALKLGGAAPQNVQSFIGAAYLTFDNALANPEIVADLTSYSYDETGLLARRAVIEALDEANQAQELAKGNSQRATAERDAAMAEVRVWMGKFRRIARRALMGRDDLLVKLGL